MPRGTAGGGARCPEAATGTLRTGRQVPTGVCAAPAVTGVQQTPVRTGSPACKVRRPLRAQSCTETVASRAGPCTLPRRRVRKLSKAAHPRVRKPAKGAHDRGSARPKSVHDLSAGPCQGRRYGAAAGRVFGCRDRCAMGRRHGRLRCPQSLRIPKSQADQDVLRPTLRTHAKCRRAKKDRLRRHQPRIPLANWITIYIGT